MKDFYFFSNLLENKAATKIADESASNVFPSSLLEEPFAVFSLLESS